MSAVCCRNRTFIKVQFACYRHRFHLSSHLMWMVCRRYTKMWSESPGAPGPQRDGMCGESVGNGRPCGLGHLGRFRPRASAFIPGWPGSVQDHKNNQRLPNGQHDFLLCRIWVAPTEIRRKETLLIVRFECTVMYGEIHMPCYSYRHCGAISLHENLSKNLQPLKVSGLMTACKTC